MKKIIALFTAMAFALTLGVAFAEEKAAPAGEMKDMKKEEKAPAKKKKSAKKEKKKKADKKAEMKKDEMAPAAK